MSSVPAAASVEGEAAALAPRPAPTTSGTGVAYFPDLATAGNAVIAAGILPATLEFLDPPCIQAVENFAHSSSAPTPAPCSCSGTTANPTPSPEHWPA
ncbi:hypothetical protein [Streptomyces sp. rh34]|uniref:hypothetical protein n=1 Tax=Streptomyces sp. rh34 TaxID=2034272 RepID=UPI001C54E546|nr:hypothetical protein [Streptomyces sp. rh34]